MKLSKRQLLEEIYKNVRWNGDVLEKLYNKGQITTLDGEEDDLIGDRPTKRP